MRMNPPKRKKKGASPSLVRYLRSYEQVMHDERARQEFFAFQTAARELATQPMPEKTQ